MASRTRKRRSSGLLKWMGIVFLALVVIGVLANLFGDKSEDTASDSASEDTVAVENNGEHLIDEFIASYNAAADVDITDTSTFDPQDRESGHYRTEYRLGAWEGSIGMAGSIGESTIDIVCYGSHGGYAENKDLRVYVTAASTDELMSIFRVAAKAMDDSVTEEELQEVVDHVAEYGEYNPFNIGEMEPGTIFTSSGELMLSKNG